MAHTQNAEPATRILVVANETVESRILGEAIRGSTGDRPAQVAIVAPALNSRLRHWVSDVDGALEQAEARLSRTLEHLIEDGLPANGRIGDSEPLQAISDALHFFPADQIIVATPPEARSNWLTRRLVDRIRRRFPIPVLHIVIDGDKRQEYIAGAVGAPQPGLGWPAAA